jgi:hypothetical protein
MGRLFKLALLAGVGIAVAKMLAAKREWSGLTEPQVREKIDGKLSRRIDDAAKRGEIADMVVSRMKQRGMIQPAPVEVAADPPPAAGDGDHGAEG